MFVLQQVILLINNIIKIFKEKNYNNIITMLINTTLDRSLFTRRE